ncbi:hypothetical protein CEXT_283031, partial [Caerostris extrusa]
LLANHPSKQKFAKYYFIEIRSSKEEARRSQTYPTTQKNSFPQKKCKLRIKGVLLFYTIETSDRNEPLSKYVPTRFEARKS